MPGDPTVQWDDNPPENPGGRFIPIYSPKCGQTMRLIVLSDHVEGVWTHWVDGRTIPCVGKTAGCICGRLDLGRRWKGYVAAYEPEHGRVVLAELTLGAYTSIRERLTEVSYRLRGKVLRLWRAGGKDNARCSASFLDKTLLDASTPLPAAPDVRETLRHIWGL